jgi:hypothetical protein
MPAETRDSAQEISRIADTLARPLPDRDQYNCILIDGDALDLRDELKHRFADHLLYHAQRIASETGSQIVETEHVITAYQQLIGSL